MNHESPLFSVTDLSMEFRTRSGIVKALDAISFSINPGETVGIVGESGSGKSVLSFTIMHLLEPTANITKGQIRFKDQMILDKGRYPNEKPHPELSMIFQSPLTALNPICKVGQQIMDVLKYKESSVSSTMKETVFQLLERVKIPQDRFYAYPFQLSGGMCQRILIAMALARSPSLLIADEPTTGLDVVTQQAIMELIKGSASNDMATILITHDLGLAASYCNKIIVMHAGQILEIAQTDVLFKEAKHPYTAKLVAATPGIIKELSHLQSIPGNLPDLRKALPACRYSHRCERYSEICDTIPLTQKELTPDHRIACWNPL